MPRLPDFLIVGAAKSGTSSLASYLDAHPGITMVSNRLEYFGEFGNPSLGDISREEYLEYFAPVPPEVLAGEKSVSYLYSRQAPSEIHALNPDTRIIMILRDPVARAYSDYWHRVRTGVEPLSFAEALDAEEERIAQGARFELHYAQYGLYHDCVAWYMELFGPRRVLVLRYEDLKESPEVICARCFAFLGVDAEYAVEDFPIFNKGGKGKKNLLLSTLQGMARTPWMVKTVRFLVPPRLKQRVTGWMSRSHAAGKIPPMEEGVEKRLRRFFAADLSRLEALLGWELDDWK